MKDFHKNTNLALIVIDIQKSDFADIDSEDKAMAYLQNGTVVKRSEMIEKINLFIK